MGRALGVASWGLALLLAAFAFDDAILFVPGVAFALLGLVIPCWVGLAGRRVWVLRALSADRLVEDEPLEATIEVGYGRLGVPGGLLLDPLARDGVTLATPPTRARERCLRVPVVARFSRRGRQRIDPPSVVLRDPFGLVRKARRGAGRSTELLVLPRTERLRWATRASGERADAIELPSGRESLAAVDVDGLRPYRHGAPASRIHWPALARGAGLLERRLRADGDSGPLVALDTRCAGAEEHLDAAVRAAASIAFELGQRGRCDLLLPGQRRAIRIDQDPLGWARAHAQLALVEAATEGRAAVLELPRARLVFYVAARAPDRSLLADGRVAVLVLPDALAAGISSPPRFEVAGCVGFVVGAPSAQRRRRAA